MSGLGLEFALARHRTIGIDTRVFIYHFEGSGSLADAARDVFVALRDGICEGVTSVITLAELLVEPIRLSDLRTARSYELVMARMPGLEMVDVNRSRASLAAGLRVQHGIQMADALRVAAAIGSGASAFVTNDLRLRRLVEIDVLMLDDFVTGN